MFEEYLADARQFVDEGRRATNDGDADAARRSYRAAAIVGNASAETFINFLASTFEAAPQSLEPYELALLVEKRFGQVDGDVGAVPGLDRGDKIAAVLELAVVGDVTVISDMWP